MTIFVRVFLGLILIALVVALTIAGQPVKTSQPNAATSKAAVVATVGGRPITLREVEDTVALPLYLLEGQRHQVLQQALQQLIDEYLLQTEASNQGVSLTALLDKASESASVARLANLPAPVRRVRTSTQDSSLTPDERARVRQALIVSLRRQTDVHVMLAAPKPPVIAVGATSDRRLGPDDAPVTIVEFSDFQCPYCQKSVHVLKELRRLYGEKIRLMYRDHPGPRHLQAVQAAEAARCAGEQGKFWEFHDLLFDRQSSVTGWEFLSLAKELQLKTEPFESCLRSGRFREAVLRDVEDGLKLGITSTPTFFVNGRPLVGAQPLEHFQAIIDKLLAEQQLS